MRSERVVVVGAGGHGRVVMDAILASSLPGDEIVFADDDAEVRRASMLGRLVYRTDSAGIETGTRIHVAIGDNRVRQQVSQRLEALGAILIRVNHPRAFVSPYADLEAGSFVAAGAVVAPMARVCVGAIINHGAVVDHDCVVESYAHIAPNATLGGAVRVGQWVIIGAGANLLPEVKIGEGAIVGAGAVVTEDVAAGDLVGGVPAKVLRRAGR